MSGVLPLASTQVALVYSPHAGSASLTDPETLLRAEALLRGAGLKVVDALSVKRMNALNSRRLAARWRRAGARAIIAAGGDGSVGAVATLASQADLPLGILPLGTANDIARALGLPERPDAAARLIADSLASGEERLIDAGELVPVSGAPTSARGGLFLHALTLGLNVEFARLATDAVQRQRWGKLTYAASAIESLSHFSPLPIELRVTGMNGKPVGAGDEVITTRVALLAVINLPVFGGWIGLRVPYVRADDRLLDFIMIEAEDTITGITALATALETFLAAQASGEHGDPPAFPGGRWFRARSASITTPEPAQITLDGELRGMTPATVRIAERPARVLAPGSFDTTRV